MTDDDKLLAEIEAAHRADDAEAELMEGNELFIHSNRAALLAIVRRQREREAALREALTGSMECIEYVIANFTDPARIQVLRHMLGVQAQIDRKALAGGNDE